uniref:Uncharacterized protein n=1 Tax=Arundo donax TaxID=35708 RepID=A0A0A9GTK4_ARUDO
MLFSAVCSLLLYLLQNFIM